MSAQRLCMILTVLILGKDYKTRSFLLHRSLAYLFCCLRTSKIAPTASLLKKFVTTTKNGTEESWKARDAATEKSWTFNILPSASLAWTSWAFRPSKGAFMSRPLVVQPVSDRPTEQGFVRPLIGCSYACKTVADGR